MSTINDRVIIDQLIAGNGRIDPEDAPARAHGWPPPGDPSPLAIKIIEYRNNWGVTTWGVAYETDLDPDRYDSETSYIHNPRVIWSRS